MAPSKSKPVEERDDDASEPYSDELDVSSPEVIETGADGDVAIWDNSDSAQESDDGEDEALEEAGKQIQEAPDSALVEENEEEDHDEHSDAEAQIKRKLSTVSFGALAKAQNSVSPRQGQKRKRTQDEATEAKLQALRARLKELSEERGPKRHPPSRRLDLHNKASLEQQSDSDSSLSDTDKRKGRLSKHAPAEQSSKKTVSRRRDVVGVPKPKVRDPRFDATTGTFDRERVRKNYAFLDDYVDSEIKQIKATLREQKALAAGSGTKKQRKGAQRLSAEELEELKRELVQKESRRAAQVVHDRERDVVRDHKSQEKQRIKEGKKPYFLKKSEVKKQVLVKRFEGMSEGKRGRVMEKKRRRVAGKERKNMPESRRT
jgi:ribosomal RNA-processing protein 36